MTSPKLIKSLIAALVVLGTSIGVLWKSHMGLEQSIHTNFEAQLYEYTLRIQSLEKDNLGLMGRIQELEKIVLGLEREKIVLNARFKAFSNSHETSPFPMWIKDRSGRVLSCNKAYEKLFLLPMGKTVDEYIDGVDSDVWPKHIASEFRDNDLRVMRYGQVLDTFETVPTQHNKKRQVRVVKWPTFVLGMDTPIGVSGIAIVEELDNAVVDTGRGL